MATYPSDATFVKQPYEQEFASAREAVTYATPLNINGAAYPRKKMFTMTLTGNLVINIPTNGRDGQVFQYYLTASGGARTVSFEAGIKAPTLRSAGVITQNKVRMIELTNVAGVWHCTDDWEQDMAMAIGAGDVGATELAADAVTTAKILNANVTAAKLAADSVETAKIVNLNVTAAKLAADSVETAKILNLNVTEGKLAANAVTTAKIANSNVTFAKLAVAPKHILSFPLVYANVTDADILTEFVPGFKGKIIKFSHVCNVVTTDVDGETVLNLEIGTTNVTGGEITLGNAAMKTKGLVTNGAAITAGNAFGAADAISIEASGTTAIDDGSGVLLLVLEQTD
jgi:hypothetical protein